MRSKTVTRVGYSLEPKRLPKKYHSKKKKISDDFTRSSRTRSTSTVSWKKMDAFLREVMTHCSYWEVDESPHGTPHLRLNGSSRRLRDDKRPHPGEFCGPDDPFALGSEGGSYDNVVRLRDHVANLGGTRAGDNKGNDGSDAEPNLFTKTG